MIASLVKPRVKPRVKQALSRTIKKLKLKSAMNSLSSFKFDVECEMHDRLRGL